MLVTQIGLILGIGSLGYVDPVNNMALVAAFASVIAFLSASQDVAIDAYRREILSDEELGLGNAIHVQAYRIARSGARVPIAGARGCSAVGVGVLDHRGLYGGGSRTVLERHRA